MRFKKVYNFTLMKTGKTQNDLVVNADIIEESVIHHAFDNAPIVFNENENFKDYRDDDLIEGFVREEVVGVVLPGTVDFDGLYVTGDVMLLEEFASRTHFDDWSISYNESGLYIDYSYCKLFSKEELE